MASFFSQRHHFFEFGDQPWLTGVLRASYLDGLNLGLRLGGQFSKVHLALHAWADHRKGQPILDLGSGGGGPVETILRAAEKDGLRLPKIYLSDLFPSPRHYQNLQDALGADRIDYLKEPLSAWSANQPPFELRSICSTFHHFKPAEARLLVERALTSGSGLFILEPLQRNLRHFLMVLLSGPFPYMLAPFFADRWSWRKFLLCTVLPVAPLMVAFDGCVSVLRTYTAQEITDMIPPALRDEVEVHQGTLPYMGLYGALHVSLIRKPT